MNRKNFLAMLIIMACMLFSAQLASANLVTNGGFEDGTTVNYNMVDWSGIGAFQASSGDYGHVSHGGNFYAGFGWVGRLGSITQTLATTPGQQYDLSYYFASDGYFTNQFVTTVGGNVLFDQSNIPFQGWTLYDYVFTATSSLTDLTFSGRDDPAWLALDDVSVTPVGGTPAPEPATMLLLGLGLVGLAGARRKFKK
jgi:Protein of unknown function (DUF642)/PEP-CTERM motif